MQESPSVAATMRMVWARWRRCALVDSTRGLHSIPARDDRCWCSSSSIGQSSLRMARSYRETSCRTISSAFRSRGRSSCCLHLRPIAKARFMLGSCVFLGSMTCKVTGLVGYHCRQRSNGKVLTRCTTSSLRLQVPNRSRNKTAPLAPFSPFQAFTCSRELPINSDWARSQIARKHTRCDVPGRKVAGGRKGGGRSRSGHGSVPLSRG